MRAFYTDYNQETLTNKVRMVFPELEDFMLDAAGKLMMEVLEDRTITEKELNEMIEFDLDFIPLSEVANRYGEKCSLGDIAAKNGVKFSVLANGFVWLIEI